VGQPSPLSVALSLQIPRCPVTRNHVPASLFVDYRITNRITELSSLFSIPSLLSHCVKYIGFRNPSCFLHAVALSDTPVNTRRWQRPPSTVHQNLDSPCFWLPLTGFSSFRVCPAHGSCWTVPLPAPVLTRSGRLPQNKPVPNVICRPHVASRKSPAKSGG
jgi:hypothetical protein